MLGKTSQAQCGVQIHLYDMVEKEINIQCQKNHQFYLGLGEKSMRTF